MRSTVALGALLGLGWAAGFRGWMALLVGEDSNVGLLTFLLVLLPGSVAGGLLGLALAMRRATLPVPRVLAWTPVVLLTALLDPELARALVTTGEGSGSLVVVVTSLCLAVAVAGRRRALRAWCGLVASAGLLLIAGIASLAAPLTTLHGAWVAAYGVDYVVLLGLASSLGLRKTSLPRRGGPGARAVTALVLLAWASALGALLVVGSGSAPWTARGAWEWITAASLQATVVALGAVRVARAETPSRAFV